MSREENRVEFNQELQDMLRIEGVGYKGFGIIPKYVMLDTDLSAEAKAIYAYFCSYAGQGDSAFPAWKTIVKHLCVNKDTYYKHLKHLTEQGYIKVKRCSNKSGGFYKNIYVLVTNPKKFEEKPPSDDKQTTYEKIRFTGLKAAGYGMIPKAPFLDDRLTIKAKAIYAYFCSYSGSGNSSFPLRCSILKHLGMSLGAYNKHYRLLVELNYITVVQRRKQGRMSVNDYYLNDNPNQESVLKDESINKTNLPDKQDANADKPLIEPCVNFSETDLNCEETPCINSSETAEIKTELPCTNFSEARFSEVCFSEPNINKDIIKTGNNKNKSIYPEKTDGANRCVENEYYDILAKLKQNTEFDLLTTQTKYQGWLEDWILIVADKLITKCPFIRVNKTSVPTGVVVERMLKLGQYHYEHVKENIDQVDYKIKNIGDYIFTSLFNSVATLETAIENDVNSLGYCRSNSHVKVKTSG